MINGNGSELGDIHHRKKRSKRKLITQKLSLSLLEVSEKFGDPDIRKGYRNTFFCQNKIYSTEAKLYGKYCKNRFCTLCSAIRKAVLINKYLPVLSRWKKPHFVTLTVKSVRFQRLKEVMKCMQDEFRAIVQTYRKRNLRGKGKKLVGIRAIESGFNPKTRTYNPHFHIVVADEEMARILVQEWMGRSKPKWTDIRAQKIRPVFDNFGILTEVIKYSGKIISEPGSKKAANIKGGLKPKTKKPGLARIYTQALNHIFHAMKGTRIFERFGFNLPRQESPSCSKVVLSVKEWRYVMSEFDWLDEAGTKLTNYRPDGDLLKLLFLNVDTVTE